MARVPIYGSWDAGRHFWKKLRTVALEAGMKESTLSPAFYHHSAEGSVQAMLGTHVDDILFATKEGHQGMDKILTQFETKEVAEGKFRFCGKEIEQDESGSVRVTCRDTTLNISQSNFRTEGRSKSDKANEGEVAQLRSVIGSLSRIARQCRPDLSYMTKLCDPLTKRMRADRLRKAMEEGILDLVPSDRSILNKMKKQKAKEKEDATGEA